MRQIGSIGIIDVIYLAIVLIISIGIYASIDTNTSTAGWTTPAIAAKGNTTQTLYSGFNTLAQAPTIQAAVVILGVVSLLATRR